MVLRIGAVEGTWACESAQGDNSFLKQFARKMGSAGYHLCGVYGYTETFWTNDDIGQLQGNQNFTNTTKYHKTAGPNWVNSPAAHGSRVILGATSLEK